MPQSLKEPSHICTQEEFSSWVTSNLNLHLEIQEHKGCKNLVATFTPFPIKYYNYVKRYYKKGKWKINTYNSIYIQLQKGLSYHYLPEYNDFDVCYWFELTRGDTKESIKEMAANCYQSDIDLNTKYMRFYNDNYLSSISFGKHQHKSGVGSSNTLKHKYTYALSPTDVRKGYRILLQNLSRDTYLYSQGIKVCNLTAHPIYAVVYVGGSQVTHPQSETISYNTEI